MPILRSQLSIVAFVTPALVAAQSRPSDEHRPDFDRTAAPPLSEIVRRYALPLANAPAVPAWNRDAEFRATRRAPQP